MRSRIGVKIKYGWVYVVSAAARAAGMVVHVCTCCVGAYAIVYWCHNYVCRVHVVCAAASAGGILVLVCTAMRLHTRRDRYWCSRITAY
jgi:hypothetical protein